MLAARWIRDLAGMLFPRVCEVCGGTLVSGERLMCLRCRAEMPLSGFERYARNPLLDRLISLRAPVDRAHALFLYTRDTPYARLIQRAKYNNRPGIVRDLADDMARLYLPPDYFSGIDAIVPVPMPQARQRARGYNQAMEIAEALALATGVPVGDYLVARPHDRQARKGREERMRGADETYRAIPEAARLDGASVMVVDDVITTGATITACCDALRRAAPTVSLSVLALAAAAD